MDADATISSGSFFCCSSAATTAMTTVDATATALAFLTAMAAAANALSGSYCCSAAVAAATDSAKIRQRGSIKLPLSHSQVGHFSPASPAPSAGTISFFGYEACFRRIHNSKRIFQSRPEHCAILWRRKKTNRYMPLTAYIRPTIFRC